MKPYLLVLENFQSLRERTEIPIGPITFLYGPNSAGKSCIDDAFALLASVFSNSITSPNSMFKRWTRSEMCNVEQHKFSIARIELHCQIGRIFAGPSDVGAFGQITQGKNGLVEWFEKNNWNVVLGLEGNVDGIIGLTLACGSETVFYIQLSEYISELEISLKAFGRTYNELTEKYFVDEIKGKKSYKFECEFVSVKEQQLSLYKGKDLDREIIAIVNSMLADMRNLDMSRTNLGADRATIRNSSLSMICTGDRTQGFWIGRKGLPYGYFRAPVFEMSSNEDSNFEFIKKLAKSSFQAAHDELNPPPNIDKTEAQDAIEIMVGWNMDSRHDSDEMLHIYVNRCLREYLFLDQGYQLLFDALEIKPATNIDVRPLAAALMIGSLVDKSGRRFTFEDVGTGISCVIPVLVAVHSGSGFIQQPELHLHPALQSALGDVFIEAVHRGSARHFIETHSEYILLRCLRRIRETSAGKHPDESPLSLRPEDLSVLYFEPQPEGFTKVKKIRVSTQGDFVDRWPRGFFEERGKELFDE